MNYLELGAKTLYDRMLKYSGVEILYARKGFQSVTLIAIPGRVVSDSQDANGVIHRETVRDFILNRSDFANMVPNRPVKGDQITQKIATSEQVFVVGGDDLATPPFAEADSYGVAWRVHTKRISNA